MSYNEYLRRYNPQEWRAVQREAKRKPFETDEELDRRLFIGSMVKSAVRIIRRGLK